MHSCVLESCSIIRVQTWDSDARVPPALQDLLGIVWPRNAGAVTSGSVDVLCVGPTDWLVIAVDPDAASCLRRLDAALEGSAFRTTNVSQALARIEIDGPEARELLSKGCAVDLHSSRFLPGSCARTRFAGMPVIVHCTGACIFQCIVTRSYADYLVSWLADAVLEFETAI